MAATRPIDRPRARRHTAQMAKKSTQSPLGSSSIEPAPSVVAGFERSLDELEQLVQRMEKGEMSLDESLGAYERGVELYRQCQSALQQAELRVKLLSDLGDPDHAERFAPDVD
jgi:exodeoxyribonuclease VII small subunit